MNRLRNFAIVFIVVIIRSISPVYAQQNNPCPAMRDYQMSFSDFNLDVYDIPNINGEIIAEIPAGRRFSLSDIYAKYYDDFCWYEIITFSVDERGWIAFQPNDTQRTDIPSNQDEFIIQSTSPNITPEPSPTVDSSRAEATTETNSHNNEDLLIIVYLFIAGAIGLSIVIGKLAVDLLNTFSTKPSQNKFLKKIGSETLNKITASRTNGSAKRKVINVTYTDIVLPDEIEENMLDSIIKADIYEHFLLNDSTVKKSNINTDKENIEELTQSFGLSLEYCITNFNQGNKDFFDDPSRFQYLKPTESVIHGKVGNLGIGDRQEFEEGERSQASYLAFTIGEEIWLIPNLMLSRWQRLLTNSSFFDSYSNLQNPNLVKPAKLLLVGDRRWQIVEKGVFN
ncbi:hypothetical protein [Synechocystis sp. CACIAM 05]|uniref:hypothetical protein n=1 Tax=Synechocystis sp. CACIAM 05 TaxID=1933929 RepID=UPI00138E615F|nr:hypothetical protein BWK47_16100 [Synechocystis sp. CACIAM 05]